MTDADGEAKTIHFTTDDKADNRKKDGLIIGENYKLAEKYSIGETSEVTQNPLVPVFTREHYKSGDWKDMTGKSVTPDAHYEVTGDTQLYQQWTANTFTVKFNSNNKTLTKTTLIDISGVNEALSAAGGLKAAGMDLPAVEEDVTIDQIIYKFVNWTDKADGSGKTIIASTPLFPKDGANEVTLYA
ncbi:MAG: hypothetical protein LBJ35_00245, partial [Spirochaetaceae bacterium]|nr:hypothetical protein [Spirochaetaceae bacterium]